MERSPASQTDDLGFDDALLRRLERLSLRAHRITGAAGGRPGALRVPAADFIDHRPYSPGDDQRHIDWPAAARHDTLFVKVGRASQAATVHVLVDVSPSMAADGRKWRLVRELAAALGWMSLAGGDRTTISEFPAADASPGWGPASGADKGAGLLAHVSQLQPAQAPLSPLTPSVERIVRLWPSGGLIVVLSDLWFSDDLEEALGLAPPPRWEMLLLHILAREELVPSIHGSFELRDAESGEKLTLAVDDELIDEYRSRLTARLEGVQRVATRHGATYALLPADWPLERAVIPFLHRLRVLGA